MLTEVDILLTIREGILVDEQSEKRTNFYFYLSNAYLLSELIITLWWQK